MDLHALRDIRESRLRRMADLCGRGHAFYRRRFAEAGIRSEEIRGLEDLDRLPLTEKADFMREPEAFNLDPAVLPELTFEERTLWNVAYTTGTTSGSPSRVNNTTHDRYHIMLQAKACGEAEGLGRGDLIANLFPLSPMPTGAFLCTGRTAEIMGLPIVSALTGSPHAEYPVRRNLDQAVEMVAAASPTVFWGVPSFVRRFLRRAREMEVGMPRARMVLTSGEPVTDALREEYMDLLRHFGAKDPQVRVRYSFTEMQGGFVQCCNGAVLQNMVPQLYYFEVVDPDTGRHLPEGEEGALALTHLHRRGTVFLRYLMGDVTAVGTERCPHCGRYGERIIQQPHRMGELVKVKGMLVNPAIVFELLSAERAVREFQLVVRKSDPNDPDSMDALVLRMEAEEAERDRLARELPPRVREAVMVRPEVEFAPPGAIHDPLKSMKARRLVDERKI